ncbi:MAG TPA: helix-turn-helix transcriptional regulator [Candidatus Rubrimentiphilum sp.]|nr:helix-turn-helix transcriptional regulator [Candidatus Rubrimentiphilum sp.]
MSVQDTRLTTGEEVSAKLKLATELARLARRGEALELLTHCDDWEHPYNEKGLLVAAEVLARRDPIEALEFLAVHSEDFASAESRFAYLVTSAFCYVNTRNFDAAREMLSSAADLVRDDLTRAARLGYERSRLAWATRHYDPNSDDMALAMSDPSPDAQFKALGLRSWMRAGLEDYAGQVQDLLAAFRQFQSHSKTCEITAVALYLRGLLRLAVETGNNEAVAAGEAAYEMIEWTPDIQEHQFLCVRALAWYAFQQGDSGRAQWLLKDSKELAPTLAWQVWAHADRAYVARLNGNQAWAAEELAQADSIAQEVEWDTTHDEERYALVMLADLFSSTDMAQAQRYVSIHTKLGRDSIDPTIAAAHDRRAVAYAKYAAGEVQAMLGNVKLAKESLEFSYETFARIGHSYRAALAAAALFRLTEDTNWLEKARSEAGRFPKSPFFRRLSELDKVEEQRVLSGLTPMQRQLAVAFSQGADLDDLSLRFSRSRFTINKQIEAIFESLGVHSRHTLRAELRQRGIL